MNPSPQKKTLRLFVAGFLIGGIAATVSVFAVVLLTGMSFGPDGCPLFPESARREAESYARLAPLPPEIQGLSICSQGGPFNRQLRMSFFGDVDEIAQWIESCPGIRDTDCERSQTDDGAIWYRIPPVEDVAAFSELIHHPERGTVIVTVHFG